MSHLDLPLIMINRIAVLTPGSMLPPYPLQPTVSVRQRGPSRSNISCVWPASWLLIGCWKSFPRSPSRGITPKHRHFWRRGRISRHAGHHHEMAIAHQSEPRGQAERGTVSLTAGGGTALGFANGWCAVTAGRPWGLTDNFTRSQLLRFSGRRNATLGMVKELW